MGNQDTHATWAYHDGTEHPDGALFDPAHTYTGSMRPLLFKVYPDLPPLRLPLDPTARGVNRAHHDPSHRQWPVRGMVAALRPPWLFAASESASAVWVTRDTG